MKLPTRDLLDEGESAQVKLMEQLKKLFGHKGVIEYSLIHSFKIIKQEIGRSDHIMRGHC